MQRTQRRTLDRQLLQRALDLRHERFPLRRIDKTLTALLATVTRLLKTIGLGRLKLPGR